MGLNVKNMLLCECACGNSSLFPSGSSARQSVMSYVKVYTLYSMVKVFNRPYAGNGHFCDLETTATDVRKAEKT